MSGETDKYLIIDKEDLSKIAPIDRDFILRGMVAIEVFRLKTYPNKEAPRYKCKQVNSQGE